ncbi:MAG: CopD family protein [Lysobacteraceae bacterium]
MVIYVWTKSLHLLFVIAWMAAVFYLPRILVNIAEAGEQPAVRARLLLMGQRLYKFGHVMFGLLLVFGLLLWLGYRISPEAWPLVVSGGWLHAKLTLVAGLFAYYVFTARWMKRAAAGAALPGSTALRWFNELPIFLALGAIYLVIGKPF